MYVKIGPHNHWFAPAVWFRHWVYWFNGVGPKENLDQVDDAAIKLEAADAWLKKSRVYRALRRVETFIDHRHTRKIYVKIHDYDTWGADHTLAVIALPLLKKLKEKKNGAPDVDDADVPEELRRTAVPPVKEFDVDANHFKRWDWVLDEIIWGLEQVVTENDSNDLFFTYSDPTNLDIYEFDRDSYVKHHARIDNALRLFGVHFRNFWD